MTLTPFPDRLYEQAEKPARYIGGEWNSIVKDKADVELRLCLVFPDIYELGLGNLGLQILYTILNQEADIWAERAYLPGPDMEALMRAHNETLRMLESQEPVTQAQGIGFTLQSELTYVNVLKIIQLTGLPLFSEERDSTMPLLFAGGPCAYNPEPLAPFLDFFVIGDGEDVILEIAKCLRKGKGAPKETVLQALAEVEGVYVPALYGQEKISDTLWLPDASKPPIHAAFLSDLDQAIYPERYITPYVQLVHDGVGVEVLRGCTHGCRFCQAGMLTRPVRERSVPTICKLLDGALSHSGMDAATLVSLSTCDHSQINTLLRETAQIAAAHQASQALPSLRLDRFSVAMADYVSSRRRSGLTFAPEAGTARLRAVINKDLTDEQLFELAHDAFSRGWTHIKLYFMIGLPTETDADVDAIAELCLRTLREGRKARSNAQLRLGVSTFVPKAFTPFQWAAQIGLEETVEKQRRLASLLRNNRRIIFGRHSPESSFIEGLLSRADRRAAALLHRVLQHGGGYESWSEHLNFGAWQRAIEETNYPVAEQFAERQADARFPWDHIDAQVSRDALFEEWQRAHEEGFTQDCRVGPCHLCGALRHSAAACTLMQKRSKQGAEEDAPLQERALEAHEDAPIAVQRLRFQVGRTGRLRLLSHLETAEAWIRALRRAGLALASSQGFHARPKVTFSTAMPVGEESEAELMDVVLEKEYDPAQALAALRAQLPDGFTAYTVEERPMKEASLMAQLQGHRYLLLPDHMSEDMAVKIEALLEKEQWHMERMVKNRSKFGEKKRKAITIDLRPLVSELACVDAHEDTEQRTAVTFTTLLTEGRLAKPKELIMLLGLDPIATRVRKTESFLKA